MKGFVFLFDEAGMNDAGTLQFSSLKAAKLPPRDARLGRRSLI
jgi:hypothetical protein